MGIFNKLFGKSKNQNDTKSAPKDSAASVLAQQKQHFDSLAAEKSSKEKVSQEKLLNIFATYFAPKKDFYSVPGSDKYVAYFNAVNTARDEMFKQQSLFKEATGWSTGELVDLVNNPKPGITNMMICGMIFLMGQFAVIKDAVYCVDFSEAIPNCVALYLLLIAQKQPEDKRTQVIDAGEGTDTKPLSDAMDALKICDPAWNYKIW